MQKSYLCVCLSDGDKQGMYSVHALMLETFIGPRPDGQVGRHLDGNRENLAIENLAWGTPEENRQDAYRHGVIGPQNLDKCTNGHEYSDENRMPNGPGKYKCRICFREVRRRRRKRKRELTQRPPLDRVERGG
jgi:hypothetical protein